MASDTQVAGSKRGRCGHAHTPILRKKMPPPDGIPAAPPGMPSNREHEQQVDPVMLYGGNTDYLSPLDSRSSSTPCSDVTWMSNPYLSASSVSSTPYPSGSDFFHDDFAQAQPPQAESFSFELSKDPHELTWIQPHLQSQACGDSPPCTDPTCADALPCPEGEISCNSFPCPRDEVCFDQHCLPDLLDTDICLDEKCHTRCPSPCFSQHCDVPLCNDVCPVSSYHDACPDKVTDCAGDCSLQDAFNCYGPPCPCIDPQCLQTNHESCSHEPFSSTVYQHATAGDNAIGHFHACAPHQHSHQHLEQLLSPLLCAHQKQHEQERKAGPCEHSSWQSETQSARLAPRPHAHHKSHKHHYRPHRFQSHSLDDDQKRIYQCLWCISESNENGRNMCGLSFPSAEGLHQHIEQAHVDGLQREDLEHNGFFCRWQGCDRYMCRSFHARPKLKRHLQTHTLYKPFECAKCGIQMKTKDAMEKHERTHTGERPYECSVPGCKKIFATSTELKTHMIVHSGLKPHTCPICGEGFADSSNLSKHKKTHFIGMYRCLTCGARMKRWDQMRRHIVTQGHSTELLEDKVAQRDYKALMEKEFRQLPESERMIG